MNKFWPIVTLLLLVGVVSLFLNGGESIKFTDLETECRYDRNPDLDVDLQGNRISFEGNFPVENIETDLSSSYSEADDRVTLTINTDNQQEVTEFFDNCKASAIYKGSARLDEGRYLVTVNHDDERAYRSVIQVK